MGRAGIDSSASPPAVLGGTLVRAESAVWKWKDGALEARVREYIVAPLVPRCGRAFVVRRRVAESSAAMTWIVGEHQRGRVALVGEEFLVPEPVWQLAWRSRPAGVEWDERHERAILDRAFRLGWRPPTGFVSSTGWSPR